VTNRPPSGARGDRSLRRRPPCRNFGGDARSQEIAARIVERSAQISSLHWEQLADIAEFDRSEAWRGDGSVSMVTWVTGQCGVSTSTARQWVRSATNLETLPCLAEGLASGQLSLDLVEPLAEVASADTDAALREASAHWSVRQARELVAWHRAQREATAVEEGADGAEVTGDAERGAERSGPEGDPLAGSAVREFQRRTLRFNDTRRTVWIAFTTDDYATAKSALVTRVAADKRGMMSTPDSSDEPDSYELDPLGYVPYDQRLYDTMMRLFRVKGAPLSGSRPPVRPRVVVHAPLELLLGCSASATDSASGAGSKAGAGTQVAEVEGVGPIPAEVARRLACDAHVVLSVDARDGSILDQGRARRDPTVAQRIEITRRDKGCRFPGCTFTEFTDVHHVRHWIRGGATNLDNLVTLCDRHHRAVHELGWVMRGDANAVLSFTGPHGRVMKTVPSPTWPKSSPARAARDGPVKR
jgi:Domain of unknown function (DUF222)/HNH endonuclease